MRLGERGQSTASIGTTDLRNLWYGFVGKGTINKVDWNEGSTSPTDLAGRAKPDSLDLLSPWEDPLGLGGNQTRSVAPLNLSEDNQESHTYRSVRGGCSARRGVPLKLFRSPM